MAQTSEYKDSFYGWAQTNRYFIYLSIFCAFVPLITEQLMGWIKGQPVSQAVPSPHVSLEISYLISMLEHQIPFQFVNILFITFALYKLARMKFLQVEAPEKEKKLHEYVTNLFGENSTLARNTPGDLFKRINTGIKQFYYSWVIVWVIWLIMYIIKSVYTFYLINQELYNKFLYTGCSDGQMLFRIENFLENNLNMLGSFVLFFIYMDITVSTVHVGTLTGKGRGNLQIGVFFMILIGTTFGLIDLFSIVGCADYDRTQFFLRLFIGVIASMSIIMVLGRLNTSYLKIPQFLMMCLYLYATVQMLYPLVYTTSSGHFYVEFVTSTVTIVLNLLVFCGKVTLLLVLLWIARNNRFMFFLLHKANSLSDSTFMIRRFNKYYEGCPDK